MISFRGYKLFIHFVTDIYARSARFSIRTKCLAPPDPDQGFRKPLCFCFWMTFSATISANFSCSLMQEHFSSALIARHPPRVVAQMVKIPISIDVISFFISCPFFYERSRYKESLYHITLDVKTIRSLDIDAGNGGTLKKISIFFPGEGNVVAKRA